MIEEASEITNGQRLSKCYDVQVLIHTHPFRDGAPTLPTLLIGCTTKIWTPSPLCGDMYMPAYICIFISLLPSTLLHFFLVRSRPPALKL